MIKPDWNIFKAKFSENPQHNFEWLCYLLFCKEFNKPYGIFRYVNQSGMETNPIKSGSAYVSWEAKFYEDRLSSHKRDFIKKLEIAKKRNPEVSKLYFYTPLDWAENSQSDKRKTKRKTKAQDEIKQSTRNEETKNSQIAKRKTQAQEEIEKKASDLNIEIVWRGASFFETPFVSIQNETIAKHFFSLDKNIFDSIKAQQTHSENILNEVQTNITFRDQLIEIDRSDELDRLENNSEKILILSGPGGVGKTSIIKNLYENLKGKIPLYIFKATEFEITNIQRLFRDVSLQEFIEGHIDDKDKIIVIDSAEKLIDLKNIDSFKEFLTILIQKDWKIIFTTRDNYLEDLNYQFFEIYKIIPTYINIRSLELNELEAISNQYGFSLPKDEKLLNLIKNPFYLSEYLKFYKEEEQLNYVNFRRTLWNKTIIKSNPSREQCFLKTAFERANKGQFFVTPKCEPQILDNELRNDGILGYESPYGYFITHDIYEEWALEKIVEVEFVKRTSNQELFENIGHSLPIRRSFRNWVSEQLLLEETSIKEFIEEIIENEEIELFWKDEILVSILLSDYSDFFFENFKDKLLINDQELLRKSSFLLRIACKEVDEELIKQLEVKNLDLFSLKYVLTKPKGQGWESLIQFVFENLNKIGIENISFILPVIYDWNSKFKEGTTTRFSSLIALYYYQMIIKKDAYLPKNDTDRLIKIILYGSSEIKNELIEIFDEIIKNQWKYNKDPYYDMSKVILTELDGISVCKVLPEKVLQIASLFWLYTPSQKDFYAYSNIEVDQYYGIEENNADYFPASSYQTPVYWLLKTSSKKTIDFILDFTNKTVEFYAKSDLDADVEKVEVFIKESNSLEQYISERLWNTYRGTQVAPHILESIHAALEKYFLEIGNYVNSTTLENMLFYLIRNSISASISAVVTSIVLAYPEKTFNVAVILFKTKEFFLYDTSRLCFDQMHKNSLLMLRNSFGFDSKNKIYEDERLEACDAKHRKMALEHLFLNYQLFRGNETSVKEAEKRKIMLWQILDNYYKELPNASEETEIDKTWRLFLARMDRRKMSPTAEVTDDGILIDLNPEIEPTLKEYIEKSLEQSIEPMKHSSLKLWAHHKMRNNEEYKNYDKYENNPKLALKEAKKICEDGNFSLLNYTIPVEVCSVLVRDYLGKLSKKERTFCKDIILEVASLPLSKDYQYQVADGTQIAISVLPILLKEFPEEKESIKTVLLLTLFNDHSIVRMENRFNSFSIMSMQKVWENNFDDAQSILFGYLTLKPKYEKIKEKLIRENCKEFYQNGENAIIKEFIESETNLHKVINNELSFEDLKGIKVLDLYILNIAFQLIPLKTNNKEHKEIVREIISTFAEKLMSKDRDNKIDYNIRRGFLRKYAFFVLNSPKEEIKDYLKPFLDNFKSSEAISDLFEEFISAEYCLNKYECFWEVWNMFNPMVIELCGNGDEDYWNTNKIIKSYLFAQTPWETNAELKALKNENKIFFREISKKIGHCPSVLYAISKLLNGIGSSYLNDGIFWISGILQNNKRLWDTELETNTIYYLENLSKIYIYKNRENIKKTRKLKQDTLIILDFLIKKESVIGYMLRETII